MQTISRQNKSLLKRLLDGVPPGFLIDVRWLRQHGFSRQLAHKYVQQGWLEHPARGLFRRPFSQGVKANAADDWMIPLLSAQWIMDYDTHVGGPTALALRGYRHYLPLGGKEVAYLYSDETPSWLIRLPLRSELRVRTKRLFDDPQLGIHNAGVSQRTVVSR